MTTASSPHTVFVTGATGYIGGAVLQTFLEAFPSARFLVQYRQDAHEPILKAFSKQITPVKASLSDHAILEEYAAKSDVVIAAADADDLGAAKAVINGLESAADARASSGQRKAVLLHTSGTGVLVAPEIALGELDPTDTHDGDVEQIEQLPPSRPHREIDIAVAEALKRGKFLGYIVLPSTIFGRGTGPIHTISQQVPNTVRFALENKRATYIEPGTNVWASVSIGSLSTLYLSLAQQLLSADAPPPPANPYSHYIFGAAADFFSWKDISVKVGDILKGLGELEEGGARGIDRSEYKGRTAKGALTGTNSRAVAERARQLVGWEDTDSIWEALEGDVKDAVAAWKAERA